MLGHCKEINADKTQKHCNDEAITEHLVKKDKAPITKDELQLEPKIYEALLIFYQRPDSNREKDNREKDNLKNLFETILS